MSEPLLIVDVQRGFLNEFTRHLPERLARLIGQGDYGPILFTRFVNVPESPYRRFLDWHECADEPDTLLAPELEEFARPDRVFVKRGFTGLPDELSALLCQRKFETVVIAGIDTDMCVLKIAMDVFDLGIRPVVINDCCASTAGAQAHLSGLAILSRNIGPQHLRDAGLGEGTVAAAPES